MAGPSNSSGCHPDVARGKAPACPRSLSSSPALEHPLEQSTTPSSNGSPEAAGPLGRLSPSSVEHSLEQSLTTTGDESQATIPSLNGSPEAAMGREASRHPQGSPHLAIDVEARTRNNLAGVLAGDGQTELRGPCRDAVIPKVRAQLRRVADDLFTPHSVTIGPYHGDVHYWQSTEEKTSAVQNLRRRGVDLKQVVGRVQSRARRCYTHHMPAMDSDRFCRMLLDDGCYLISFFLNYGGQQTTTSSDEPAIDNTVVRDVLYLLENQIPLLVIDEILQNVRAPGEDRTAAVCFAEPVRTLLKDQLYISEASASASTSRVAPSTSSHLLDLVHFYLAGSRPQGQDEMGGPRPRPRTGRWRRATEYRRYADLQFKPRSFRAADEWTILDVQLDGGILSFPLLRVDSNTWTLLRNLIALEEHKEARPVTAYCLFMSQLACTAEDVQLLRGAKVMEHFLGSDESAADGFAGLCHGVVLDIDMLHRNYLKLIWHRLEKRCAVPVHNFKGFFREKHFSNGFYRAVFFTAFILFSCQLVQAIYTVIAYHKPNISAAAVCCH